MQSEVNSKKGKTPGEVFEYASYTATDGTVIPYRYYLPEGYSESEKEYPLFLYMHGNGSRGSDNETQLKYYSINHAVFASDHECIILAPQCAAAPKAWTLYGKKRKEDMVYPGTEVYTEFLESGELYGSEYFRGAVELLDRFLRTYRVDTSRVYVGGGSNGSGAAWNLMALYPEVFAAGIPVSGARAEEGFVHSIAHRYKDIAIWAFHGDVDNVVPTEGTRVTCAAAKQVGVNIKYTEVEGGDHSNIWKIAADTEGLVDWLFSQKNDNFENTLDGKRGEPLPAPEGLTWKGSTASWNAVEGAGAYKVTFYSDGKKAKICFTYKSSVEVDLRALGEGEYTFTVRAYPQKNRYDISAESTSCVAR